MGRAGKVLPPIVSLVMSRATSWRFLMRFVSRHDEASLAQSVPASPTSLQQLPNLSQLHQMTGVFFGGIQVSFGVNRERH